MFLSNKIKQESIILLISSIGLKLLEFFTIIILARFLQPSDFGLFGLAFAINGFIAVFSNLGTGQYIIYKKELSEELKSNLFWLNLISGIFLTLIAILLAPYISRFFNYPELKNILFVLSFSIFFTSAGTVHYSLLQKQIKFKKIAIIQTSITGIGSITSIVLALYGMGVWSFIIPIVQNSVLLCFAYWKIETWRPFYIFDIKYLKEIFDYCKHIFLGNTNTFILQNIAFILIGKFLTIEVLGYYKFSFAMAMVLVILFHEIGDKLLMPLYTHLTVKGKINRELVLRIFQYLTLITVPAFIGLMLLSKDLIVTFFGDKWLPSVIAFRIFCILGIFAVISRPVPALLNALGKPSIRSFYTTIFIPITIFLMYLFLGFNLVGASFGYTLASIFYIVIILIRCTALMNIYIKEIYKKLSFVIVPVLIMFIIVGLIKYIGLVYSISSLMYLIFQIIAGVLVFSFSLRIFHPITFNELYVPFRDLRKKESE